MRQRNKERHPFYKNVWFWIAVVAVFFVIGTFGNHDDQGSSKSATSSSAASSSVKKESGPKMTAQQRAALNSAKTYSNTMHMSKQGILDQLTSDSGDKFPQADAQYAVDHLKVNWNENALKSAKTYQKEGNMSTEEIRDQLTSSYGEQFTAEQADYAIQHLPK